MRLELDAAAGRVRAAAILAGGAQLDHPRVHPQHAAAPTRFVYATCGRLPAEDGAGPCTPTQRFVVVDVASEGGAVVDAWHAGARRIVDEATLVAYGCGEREAWLLAPVFDGASGTTAYVVLDGADLAAGPVCELPLDTHIPWGLHGAGAVAF